MLSCILATSPAAEKIVYVDDDATGANDGSSWTNAFVYLQDALSSAGSILPTRGGGYQGGEATDVEIRIAQGTYRPNQSALGGDTLRVSPEQNAVFALVDGILVRGGYAGVGAPDPNERDSEVYRTILSGDLNGDDVEVQHAHDLPNEPTRSENRHCVVRCYGTNGLPILEGVTVTGATTGAVENWNGNLTITDCVFSWNTASFGGAIYSRGGELVLTRCKFIANWASQFGGAVCADDGTTVVLTDCVFIGNEAGVGGALAGESADITMTGCTFERNAAQNQGSLHVMGGSLAAINCTFKGNSSFLLSTERGGYGGAIGCFDDAEVFVSNCQFEGNSAISGGAIYGEYSRDGTILQDCVFIGNVADQGGALYGLQYSTVRNCVFAGNRAQRGGAADSECAGPEFVNCTFVANRAENGNAVARYSCHGLPEKPVVMINCILWDGGNEIGTAQGGNPVRYVNTDITFSDVFGGWEGEGNIDVGPWFADAGCWDPNGTPDDPNDDFFVAGDYHLKSQAGRWDPVSGNWVLDDVPSPCIDAGDPNSPVGDEPEPNGGRINLGAYGGTAEASASYSSK
ncbi:MAG: hypothetical protein KBE65_05605 [Phycisphaerae bacterium]|nr:hypothetical protein [Phycisphaerae bacterium]